MSKLGLSPEEENQLKTISEYLFFDQFKEFVTYNRFEQCFQPLFNNVQISIDKVFKNICGEKKKYLNYQRLVNSYILYKKNDPKISPDLKTFFEKLFNSILKKENTFIGKPQEKTFSFATPKACRKREFITSIKVLSDKDGGIHGFIIEYDGIVKNKLYPSKIENDLVISLDMKLGIIDNKPIAQNQVGKLEGIKEEFYRDAVTHVFGTISPKTNMISFFGFKCVSGKTVFVGFPEGDGFIFGKFGTKFHEIKVQMSLDGIILLQPGFNVNRRTNFYLNTEANKLTKEDLSRDILIQDEAQLSKLNDAIQIDKLITTPIIEENHFLDEKLIDDIAGNDYKEVVNQNPREWILKTTAPVKEAVKQTLLTVDDALKEVEKEKEKSKELLKTGLDGGEMTAKGRKRKKKNKNKKQRQRAANGKLSETRNLVSKAKKTQQKWNGKVEQIKNIQPLSFLKNKDNYQKLKDKVSQGIHEELTKLKGNFDTNVAQSLIKKIAPNPNNSIVGRVNKSVKNVIKKVGNKIKDKKGKAKLISKNMKGEIKKVLTRGEKRAKSVQKPKIKSNIIITGDSDDTKETNLFCSDAQQIINAVENISGTSTNSSIDECFTEERTRMRATKSADPQENWRLFGSKIRRLSGVLLLQTIGCVLKGIRVLNDEIDGKKIISLEERIKLFQLLDENEKIVDFLSQETGDDKGENTKKEEEEEEYINPEEDLLIPSEHPEDITSLPELETKMAQINKLLDNKNLKPEDKKKLEQLKNLYLQQKNILIENKTEEAKNHVINENKIDVNKYLQEEQEKRKKAMEEAQKKMEEEMKKNQGKGSEGKSISDIQPKETTKIFRNQELYKGKEPWTDPVFKAEKASLCPFDKYGHWILPEDALGDDVLGWDSFKWCRVEEIFDSKDYSVFHEGIAVEDIVQGKICDCYFLSVLGSLCKFPQLVEKLFYFKEKTKEHIYGIYFYINGHKKLVLIDDYLPYVGVGFKQFAMSKSEENEIWVALMEKAWAKVNGNYIRIGCGGSPNEVFDVLTEAYSEEIAIKPNIKDALWNKLIDGANKGFVMTAGTSANDDVEDVGLSQGHAFTVLGIHEIKGEKVIRLRNPWGEGEFNGDWSDYSSKWTEDLKQKYKYYEKEDGDFFMGYNDFMKYFVTMGFAKLHPKFSSSKLKIKKNEATKCQLIKVTIPQDNTLVYFQLYGKNPRIPNKNGEYPKTALSNLILVDKDFNYLGASAGNNMHICVESTLKKGEYYLFCDANFRYNKGMGNHGYTITAYCGVNIPMENVTAKNPVPDLLRKVVIDYCKKKEKANPQKNGVNVYVTKSFNKDIPYKVLTFENTSNNQYAVTVGIECKGEKSCCFYCDDVATESDIKVVKNLNAKQTISVIIMYHNLSSLFNFNCTITDAKDQKDPIYNHAVFDEEPEAIDDKGKLTQYILEKDDDSYYIGIDNSSTQKLKLKLVLEGLKVNDGPYKGQTSPIFEINANERKVFDVLIISDDDISFKFDFA